jgi:hypothetical protein
MDEFPEVTQDRLREGRGLRKVVIDAWVQFGFIHDSSVHTLTTRRMQK